MKRSRRRTRYSDRLKQRRTRSKYWARVYKAEENLNRALKSGSRAEADKWYAEVNRLTRVGAGRWIDMRRRRSRRARALGPQLITRPSAHGRVDLILVDSKGRTLRTLRRGVSYETAVREIRGHR